MTKNIPKILAIIPARGRSRRLPGKNIKIMAGKPLIAYTIEAALKSKYLNKVVVSTENREIAEISKKYGAELVKRPKVLASNNTNVTDVLLHALDFFEEKNYLPEIIILLQPTSPLRDDKDIDRAVEFFLKNQKKCQMVMSVCQLKYPFSWLFKAQKKYLKSIFSQNCFLENNKGQEQIFIPNGAIYITSSKILRKYKTFPLSKILPYFMSKEKIIDIDDEFDFLITEKLIKNI